MTTTRTHAATIGWTARAVALVTGLALVAGCSSSSSGDGRTASPVAPTSAVATSGTPTPVSTAPSSSAAATATAAPSSTATRTTPAAPSSAAGPADCTDSQLGVSSRSVSGASSHAGLQIVFTNHSSRTCILFGFPGAAAIDSHGKQLVQASRTLAGFLAGCGCSTTEHLRLTPGATASSVVEGSNGGGDECLRNVALLVTAPNTRTSTRFPFQAYSCDLQVHPVSIGTELHQPS